MRTWAKADLVTFLNTGKMKETQTGGKNPTQQNLQSKELNFGNIITGTSNESQTTLIGSNGSPTYNIAYKGHSLKI